MRRERRPRAHAHDGRRPPQPAVVQRVGEREELALRLGVGGLAPRVGGAQRAVHRVEDDARRRLLGEAVGDRLGGGGVAQLAVVEEVDELGVRLRAHLLEGVADVAELLDGAPRLAREVRARLRQPRLRLGGARLREALHPRERRRALALGRVGVGVRGLRAAAGRRRRLLQQRRRLAALERLDGRRSLELRLLHLLRERHRLQLLLLRRLLPRRPLRRRAEHAEELGERVGDLHRRPRHLGVGGGREVGAARGGEEVDAARDEGGERLVQPLEARESRRLGVAVVAAARMAHPRVAELVHFNFGEAGSASRTSPR